MQNLGQADESHRLTFSDLYLVGNSFDDFLQSLINLIPHQVRLKPGQVKKVWIDPNFKPEF